LRARNAVGHERRFCRGLAVVQTVCGAALGGLVAATSQTNVGERAPLLLAIQLVPLLPVVLLGYFVIRYSFMQIMIERTLVYAAVLTMFALFHHVAVLDLQDELAERYSVDFGILEACLILAIMIGYQPLRARAAEALRYLFGPHIDEVRRGIRDLAWQMSTRSSAEPEALVAWFRKAVAEACGVAGVSVWLFDATGRTTLASGDGRLSDAQATAIYDALRQADMPMATPRTAIGRLWEYEASLAVRFAQPAATGLVVFGRRNGNYEFSQEEANAVVLLVEQLGIVLHNVSLRAERLLAERRALQNEKLSTVGLLAGSIAHEIKNPLSAIKTLATVMAEDLGPTSPHAEDLRMILGEVDRLAATTTQLLGFVRPAKSSPGGCAIEPLLTSTLGVMRHWAGERGVAISPCCEAAEACVAADEATVREILFNLLKNAVEAVDRGGNVAVRTRIANHNGAAGHVVIEIQDDGPGISPEVQDRLFEPFLTTKATGTGLGLYLVGREVRAAGGRIECRSSPQEGTLFTVTLPVARNSGDNP
jgi:signal transduction histidine kinase